MNFLDIVYNILMYFLAIIAILVIIFLVIILPIIIIIHYTPEKKWYRITYKFGEIEYFYMVKAKNKQHAEIKFRTTNYYGGYPIVDIVKMEVPKDE